MTFVLLLAFCHSSIPPFRRCLDWFTLIVRAMSSESQYVFLPYLTSLVIRASWNLRFSPAVFPPLPPMRQTIVSRSKYSYPNLPPPMRFTLYLLIFARENIVAWFVCVCVCDRACVSVCARPLLCSLVSSDFLHIFLHVYPQWRPNVW